MSVAVSGEEKAAFCRSNAALSKMNSVFCLLCEREQEVQQLSNHIAGDLGYAPYSCGVCSFASADKNVVLVHTFQEKHFTRKMNTFQRPYIEFLVDRIVNDCMQAANEGIQAVVSKDFLTDNQQQSTSSFAPRQDEANRTFSNERSQISDSSQQITSYESTPAFVKTEEFFSRPDSPDQSGGDPQCQVVSTPVRVVVERLNYKSDEDQQTIDNGFQAENGELVDPSYCTSSSMNGSPELGTSANVDMCQQSSVSSPRSAASTEPIYKKLVKKSLGYSTAVSKCCLCSRAFPGLTRQWMHAAVHLSELLSCPYCDFRHVSSIRLIRHSKIDHPYERFSIFQIKEREKLSKVAYKCFGISSAPPTEFFDIPLLSKKKSDASEIDTSGEKTRTRSSNYWRQVPCKLCGVYMANSYFHKRAHIKSAHGADAPDGVSFYSSSQFHALFGHCFGSTICQNATAGFKHLDITCHLCGEVVTNMVGRQTHAITKHIGRLLTCPYCSSFATTMVDKFNDHVKVYHKKLQDNSAQIEIIEQVNKMVLKCFIKEDADSMSSGEHGLLSCSFLVDAAPVEAISSINNAAVVEEVKNGGKQDVGKQEDGSFEVPVVVE